MEKRQLEKGSELQNGVEELSRRGFFKKSSMLAMIAAVGSEIPFLKNIGEGFIPVAMANESGAELLKAHGKHASLVVLGDKPFVCDTPAHLLDDDITPFDKFFIRNNGQIPDKEELDPKKWTLTIGEANGHKSESTTKTVTFTIEDLKSKFKSYTYSYFLECGGNGRSEYNPPAKGNQWLVGGVSFGTWTGVRLKDLLKEAGLKDDAVYIGYYSADKHLSGDEKKIPISRGCDIKKALENETLIAYEMNGQDIPLIHGAPLRLIVGGTPASVCGKWLKQIVVRNKEHDGPKMVDDYRNPCTPVEPGANVEQSNMCVLEKMPVKSLITYPQSGEKVKLGDKFGVRGHAWCGKGGVKEVYVSIDFGQTWQKTELTKQKNKYASHRFSADIKFPTKGYYEIWARAVDMDGISQPMVIPGWNPKGYGNNATHRIAVKVI